MCLKQPILLQATQGPNYLALYICIYVKDD